MAAEADDRDVGVRVCDIDRIDTTDVRNDEVGPVGAVGRHEVMPGQEGLELAPEENVDPTKQDRGHGGSVPCLWVMLLGSRAWSSWRSHASRTSRREPSALSTPVTTRSPSPTATAASTPSSSSAFTSRAHSAKGSSTAACSPAPGTAGSTTF